MYLSYYTFLIVYRDILISKLLTLWNGYFYIQTLRKKQSCEKNTLAYLQLKVFKICAMDQKEVKLLVFSQ